MNVVKGENLANLKLTHNRRNALVRKDVSIGIRGLPNFQSIIKPSTFNNAGKNSASSVPRYQFSSEGPARSNRNSMGPPLEPPRSLKRKLAGSSSSARGDPWPGRGDPWPGRGDPWPGRGDPWPGRGPRARVLASDSGAEDSSKNFYTPRNRPGALRYISSSSRGGHSGRGSAKSMSISTAEASVVLAISEGRGLARGEIGLAAVDLKHPHLVLCQFSDTLLYAHTLIKINYFNPIEIIVPHTFCEGAQPSQLYQLIREQFPAVRMSTVQRRHYNDAAARAQLHALCAPQYSAVCLQAMHKFYALTAAAAVLKYVEYIQCVVFARESLKIEYHSSENTMIIDVGTASQLELVQPLAPSAGASCCLLGVLGPTYTAGGIRALRAAVLQPSCNRQAVEARLDAVQDLIQSDTGLMAGIQDILKKLSEVDRILLLCVEPTIQNPDRMGEAQLNQTLLLKTTMELVPGLVEALSEAQSGRLRAMKMDFENPHYKEISDRIRAIIQDDAHLERGAMGSLQRCFAVRPDINGLLDVARRTYSELIDDIQKMVELLAESHDLPIRLNQSAMKGFHIVMSIAPRDRRSFNAEDLPGVFIQVQISRVGVSMTTEELVVLDQQAKGSLNEIQKMSNIVISSLLKDLRPFMSSLYKLCENVAELDILLALAHASTVGSYIRPEFSNYLDIRNSVHPLLDYNTQTMPVPNDIYASPEHNFTIITGPNMGGKSIYIKQVAIMQIMAQLGCFVPATNAVLRLCDRVFSRIGFNDSVELNASSFVLEMKEIQHILKGITPTSLIIIDELCRGTCTEEGTSLAWAICEELLQSDAFTFFTTHFMYLTRLQDLYFNVVNLQTSVAEEVQNETRRLVYQHKVVPGSTKIERYGLALASMTNLPEETVKMAEELADLIIRRQKPQQITVPDIKDEKILYDMNAELTKESRKNPNSETTVKQMIKTFKEQNPELVVRIRSNRISETSARSSITNTRLESTNNNISSKDSAVGVIVRDTESSINLVSSKESGKERLNTQQKAPRIIYSTTDIENYEDHNMRNSQSINYTTVRSSNELLNTILRNEDNESVHELCEDKNKTCVNLVDMGEAINNIESDEIIAPEAILAIDNYSNISSQKMNNSFATPNSNVTKDTLRSIDETSDMEIDISGVNDTMVTAQNIDDETEIADALTQVLEEYSREDDNNMDSDGNDASQIDEELVTETIAEIHDSFAIESIILTPPINFRD